MRDDAVALGDGSAGAVNDAILLRGLPEDFDDWAAWGNPAWDFANVLPYFRNMDRTHVWPRRYRAPWS
jgi:choline dehydrogenase